MFLLSGVNDSAVMTRVIITSEGTCDSEDGSVGHIQLEDGQRLVPLPLLQTLPVHGPHCVDMESADHSNDS